MKMRVGTTPVGAPHGLRARTVMAEASTPNFMPAALNDLDVPYRVGAVMPADRRHSSGEYHPVESRSKSARKLAYPQPAIQKPVLRDLCHAHPADVASASFRMTRARGSSSSATCANT